MAITHTHTHTHRKQNPVEQFSMKIHQHVSAVSETDWHFSTLFVSFLYGTRFCFRSVPFRSVLFPSRGCCFLSKRRHPKRFPFARMKNQRGKRFWCRSVYIYYMVNIYLFWQTVSQSEGGGSKGAAQYVFNYDTSVENKIQSAVTACHRRRRLHLVYHMGNVKAKALRRCSSRRRNKRRRRARHGVWRGQANRSCAYRRL